MPHLAHLVIPFFRGNQDGSLSKAYVQFVSGAPEKGSP